MQALVSVIGNESKASNMKRCVKNGVRHVWLVGWIDGWAGSKE